MDKSLNEMTNEELWQLFPIIISEYKEYWVDYFISEKKTLENIINNDNIIKISHIGSTSIPGLAAKPTIDILIEIKDNTDTERLIKKLENADYIYSPQPQKPAPHMMFMKGYTLQGFEEKVFHIHIRYAGDWNEIHFRDYLLSHPEIANQYGELKLKLAKKYTHDRDGYTEAKTDFIREVNELARKR